MSWDIGCSRNIFLSLRDKSKVFHVKFPYELKRYSYAVLNAQSFPKLENLEFESQISEINWVIENGLRRINLIYRNKKLRFHNINGMDISGVFLLILN